MENAAGFVQQLIFFSLMMIGVSRRYCGFNCKKFSLIIITFNRISTVSMKILLKMDTIFSFIFRHIHIFVCALNECIYFFTDFILCDADTHSD